MKRYCPSCGHGTEYVAVRPTACGRCKEAFEQAIAVIPVSPAPAAKPVVAHAPMPIGVPRRRERPAFFDAPEPEISEDAPRETNFDPNDTIDLGGIQIVAAPQHRRKVTLEDIGYQKKTGFKREGAAISDKEQEYISQIMSNRPANTSLPPIPKSAKKPAARRKKR